MNKTPRVSLLITATVSPPSHVPIRRADPQLRLRDYIEAINFWGNASDSRLESIVFAENSGVGHDELAEVLSGLKSRYRNVEFIDATPNEVRPNVHYGYAELGMIEKAIEQSEGLKEATHFVKATGRLWFPSFRKLLDQIESETKFIVDTRDIKFWKIERRFIPFQIACFSISFFQKHLLNRRGELERCYVGFETMLYEELIGMRGQPGCCFRFAKNCEPLGRAAHYEKDYGGAKRFCVTLLRAILRQALPNIWI